MRSRIGSVGRLLGKSVIQGVDEPSRIEITMLVTFALDLVSNHLVEGAFQQNPDELINVAVVVASTAFQSKRYVGGNEGIQGHAAKPSGDRIEVHVIHGDLLV